VSQFVEGSSAFRNSIAKSASDQQALLTKLADWADDLEAKGFARLLTTIGKGRMALRPILRSYDSGLATIWNENGGALSLWRSVILRHAPELLPRIEELAAPTPVGTGTTTRTPSDQLLQALTDAYRVAAKGKLSSDSIDGV
jgi:hypothetical protein